MKLKRVNDVLFIATVVVLLYIIVAPLFPMALFWLQQHTGSRLGQLNTQLHLPADKVSATPRDNRLIIPAMLLDTPINEGSTMSALRTGPWRRPNTSTPGGGNTVIVGHRFTYSDPRGAFYYLNKVHVGDEIGIFWHGRRFIYRVSATKVVPPNEVAIESPTKDIRLTLYTCTPLWLPKNRLVVTALLEKP
ncbi:MAG TPA: class E sortase [Patescibacteria group bacterium]|nr:class E sortase [Patescibacteria group bacterium]